MEVVCFPVSSLSHVWSIHCLLVGILVSVYSSDECSVAYIMGVWVFDIECAVTISLSHSIRDYELNWFYIIIYVFLCHFRSVSSIIERL